MSAALEEEEPVPVVEYLPIHDLTRVRNLPSRFPKCLFSLWASQMTDWLKSPVVGFEDLDGLYLEVQGNHVDQLEFYFAQTE